MKIGIEASAMLRSNKTGVPHYAYNLIVNTMRRMPDDQFDLCYLGFGKSFASLPGKPANAHYRRIRIPSRVYNRLYKLGFKFPFDLLAGVKEDVFIFPNYFRWPLARTRRSVVFVYDLGYLEQPEYISPTLRAAMHRMIPKSIAAASHVVTISESTAQQIMKHYGIPASKISVITPAVDHQAYRPVKATVIADVKKKYGITKDYLLYLGTIEPRKNIAGIIRAYSALPDSTKKQYQLVLAGGKGWLDSEILELADSLPEDQLVRTGYVDSADKPALYAGAALFLYPSHYEGWGMQILEAMACDTPVITAVNSSLPEVGGSAAHYLKHNTPEELTKAIGKLLGDPHRRKQMTKDGLAHAAQFSWENSAKQLVDLIRGTAK